MLLLPSTHYNLRPSSPVPTAQPLIDTIVVHSMHNGQHITLTSEGAAASTDSVKSAELDYIKACALILDQHQVSAHYLLGRAGTVCQTVSEDYRAWHAGASSMPFEDDQRQGVNDFSIGIELLTSPAQDFTEVQYLELANLIIAICSRHPIRNIVGHDHIAPGRKTDPGPTFDWPLLKSLLNDPQLRFGA